VDTNATKDYYNYVRLVASICTCPIGMTHGWRNTVRWWSSRRV